ncbi:hypothetical protein CDR19_25070 [Ectopseudomonas toyotomiensis]|uniref:Uncharacterized protein n=1 Tax=Ectopseudomonas toyotomiensis TaxID=554344 RepID=A0A1I5YNU4_9GAMM|nr:hypothetical protein [Pseudomonas toyotomiensis]PIA66362.1 hypothetical protein CDR19_25070 [Pseudomonas toyotomiensis]SFQ24930.1 hypothetical protein SAMN05216177_109250 [Pseudomonas toyotomiensis]SFQ45863.1 hypothetical protein SAMN05216177_11526 [Pseudomonas toyotomiensis]
MTLDISQKVRTDLRAVAGSASSRKGDLEALEPRGALPARRGVGEPRQAEAVGGGAVGPFTEKENSREYFSRKTQFYSSEFLLVIEVQPLQRLTVEDGNGDEVLFEFKEPPTDV